MLKRFRAHLAALATVTAPLAILASLAWLGYPPDASAQAWPTGGGVDIYNPNATGISAVGLTTNPTTTGLRIAGFSNASVYLQLTRASATSLTMTCATGFVSSSGATVSAPLGVANVNASTGAISMANAAWSYPVTASGTYRILVAPLYDQTLWCTFGGAGASSGDLLSVHVRLGGAP